MKREVSFFCGGAHQLRIGIPSLRKNCHYNPPQRFFIRISLLIFDIRGPKIVLGTYLHLTFCFSSLHHRAFLANLPLAYLP